jgi:3-methyladenine DNA glycosylase Tag
VTERVQAVKAAEMFDAGLSWTRIAQKLHGCKDAADCYQQKERIRKAVKSLDELFRKMGIPIPTRKIHS